MPPSKAALASTRVGKGRRVVLVHGFTQTGRSFSGLVAALAESHEVVTVDLPGHGASGAVETADLEEAARLLGEAGGRATYLGYSLGGRVCLTLALEQPHLVERLVLVGASPGILDERERAARRAADEALADRLASGRLSLEAFLDEWLAGPLFAHLDAEQADRAARRSNTTDGLAHALRRLGTGTQRPAHGRLRELEMPVLVVAGADDAKFRELGAEMAERIGPNARLALVEGAGHGAPFEAPVAFAGLVLDWLASNRTG